jgi:hypothetical protein
VFGAQRGRKIKTWFKLVFIFPCLIFIVYIILPTHIYSQNSACGGKEINILTTLVGEGGGGGRYLQSILDAFDYYHLKYDINNMNVERYDVNIIFNFKCYASDYGPNANCISQKTLILVFN